MANDMQSGHNRLSCLPNSHGRLLGSQHSIYKIDACHPLPRWNYLVFSILQKYLRTFDEFHCAQEY